MEITFTFFCTVGNSRYLLILLLLFFLVLTVIDKFSQWQRKLKAVFITFNEKHDGEKSAYESCSTQKVSHVSSSAVFMAVTLQGSQAVFSLCSSSHCNANNEIFLLRCLQSTNPRRLPSRLFLNNFTESHEIFSSQKAERFATDHYAMPSRK